MCILSLNSHNYLMKKVLLLSPFNMRKVYSRKWDFNPDTLSLFFFFFNFSRDLFKQAKKEMGSEEGTKSGIHLVILIFITVLTHPDLYMLARYSEWWPLYNQRSYYYHSSFLFVLSACSTGYWHLLPSITSLHWSGVERIGELEEHSDGSRRYTLNVLWWVEKRLVWAWQDTRFRGSGSLGPKSEFLIHLLPRCVEI